MRVGVAPLAAEEDVFDFVAVVFEAVEHGCSTTRHGAEDAVQQSGGGCIGVARRAAELVVDALVATLFVADECEGVAGGR